MRSIRECNDQKARKPEFTMSYYSPTLWPLHSRIVIFIFCYVDLIKFISIHPRRERDDFLQALWTVDSRYNQGWIINWSINQSLSHTALTTTLSIHYKLTYYTLTITNSYLLILISYALYLLDYSDNSLIVWEKRTRF